MNERGTKSFQGEIVAATIPAGATGLSAPIWCNGFWLVSIQMPATWATADLTLQASMDGVNYFDVYKADGTELVISAAQQRMIRLNEFQTWPYIKLRSGTAATPVNQTAERTLLLDLRR